MPKATNLYEYYTSKDQRLPPVSERAKIYENLNLGSADEYVGSATQNRKLLNALFERDKGGVEKKKETEEKTETTETEDTTSPPDYVKDDDNLMDLWGNLSDTQKSFVNTYSAVLEQDNEDMKKQMNEALEKAKAQADPYYAEQIRIAQENLQRNLGVLSTNLEAQRDRLQEKITRINEDLRTGKGRISIDKQADLARQKRKYETRSENLEERIRGAGLTFSSRRARAERRLEGERQDVMESTRRQAQRSLEDLTTKGGRDISDIKGDIGDLVRTTQQRGAELVRQTEAQVGTKRLPDLSGTYEGAEIGGVSGEVKEEKESDILSRAGSLMSLRNPVL